MTPGPYETSDRPDPDRLLKAVRFSADAKSRGRLKVFIGMSAGVGKTYAMLRSAQKLREDGIDVVVGVVETHGRPETAALVSGLEVLPRATVDHRGKILTEMDLDGIIARRPAVVLVDELAHTNIPGSRNQKRHQDVEELLDSGIDVFTTVNVQHVESRKSVVEDISGIRVHETVPDTFFDRADEMTLIDLDPDELLRRLEQGNVYIGDKKVAAQENFFNRVNLTALREMALRFTAGRVERDLLDEKSLHGTQAVFKSGSRLLVAVFASPYSESLLRWTKQLAESLGGSWIAVHVDDGSPLSLQEREVLSRNFRLVSALGGELITTSDADPVRGLLRAARQGNVTQIIVGKSQRTLLARLKNRGGITSRLLNESGDIDVLVVATAQRLGKPNPRPASLEEKVSGAFPFEKVGWTVAGVVATWFVCSFLVHLVGYQAIGFVFLLTVFLGALVLPRAVIFVHAILAGLVWNLFFIPPLYTFRVREPADVMLFSMYFLVAFVMGSLTHRLRLQEGRVHQRELRAQTLYRITRTLSFARARQDVLSALPQALSDALGVPASLLVPDPSIPGKLDHQRGTFPVGEKEMAVATWVFSNGKPAGRGTDTLAQAEGYYFPLMVDGKTLGVAAIGLERTRIVPRDVLSLVENIAQQAAVALEREDYRERTVDLEVLRRTQSLYHALFDSVSHELKTPLTGIKGSASALMEEGIAGDPVKSRELASVISESADRLRTTVELILDMSRVESGLLKPKDEVHDVADLVNVTVQGLRDVLKDHRLNIVIPEDAPAVRCDFGLARSALENVLRNAARYTPSGTAIDITAREDESCVSLEIRDHGAGLPFAKPSQAFEKFFRGAPEKTGGLGLGLSIARGFLEAQDGTLAAANADGGGAIFTMNLPRGSFEP